MDSTKDIKVTFIVNNKQGSPEKIRLFFKDTFNNDIQIDLRPGEIVYSQTNHYSNSLKIYSRKGIIDIQNENKPAFLKYYVGYKSEEILHKQEEVDNKSFLSNLKKSLSEPHKKEIKPPIKKKIIIEKPVTETKPDVIKSDISSVPEIKEEKEEIKTIVDKAIEVVSKYSSAEPPKAPKKKYKSRKGPGRPKKRGPKKGSKRKKAEE